MFSGKKVWVGGILQINTFPPMFTIFKPIRSTAIGRIKYCRGKGKAIPLQALRVSRA
jgi:hypothetical protein